MAVFAFLRESESDILPARKHPTKVTDDPATARGWRRVLAPWERRGVRAFLEGRFHDSLSRMLEQIGLGCSVEMAYFLAFVYGSNYAMWMEQNLSDGGGAMNASVRQSAAGLVESFDNSSLELAVKAMSAQQKCMMLAGIVAMNDLVDCGFDFWRIDTLQTVFDLITYKEDNEDNG